MTSQKNEPAFTPEATIGPFFPYMFTERMPVNPAADLPGLTHKPMGSPILVSGRVLDEVDRPLRSIIIETWQANSFGRYRHPADQDEARPLDPAFDGFARLRTDDDGRYLLRTIKPGARSAVSDPHVHRAPHVRMTIFGSGIDRVVSFMFFNDETANARDPLLASLSEPDAARLIARRKPDPAPGGAIQYEFDIVLRGARETPFFDDWSA